MMINNMKTSGAMIFLEFRDHDKYENHVQDDNDDSFRKEMIMMMMTCQCCEILVGTPEIKGQASPVSPWWWW